MKKIPMSAEGRREAARKKRARGRAIKTGILVLATTTAAVWGYLLSVN